MCMQCPYIGPWRKHYYDDEIPVYRNLGLWVRDDGSGVSVWEFSFGGLGFRVPDRIHS